MVNSGLEITKEIYSSKHNNLHTNRKMSSSNDGIFLSNSNKYSRKNIQKTIDVILGYY